MSIEAFVAANTFTLSDGALGNRHAAANMSLALSILSFVSLSKGWSVLAIALYAHSYAFDLRSREMRSTESPNLILDAYDALTSLIGHHLLTSLVLKNATHPIGMKVIYYTTVALAYTSLSVQAHASRTQPESMHVDLKELVSSIMGILIVFSFAVAVYRPQHKKTVMFATFLAVVVVAISAELHEVVIQKKDTYATLGELLFSVPGSEHLLSIGLPWHEMGEGMVRACVVALMAFSQINART